MSSKCYSTFQSSSLSFNIIAACIANLIFALGGGFLNSLVILVFLHSSKLRNSVCYFLVMVLSSIDLVVVAVVHPLGITYSISKFTRNHICVYEKLYELSTGIICSLSSSGLFSMNIERYLAIVHPYFHQRKVTKPKLLLFVGFCWSYWLTAWYFLTQSRVIVATGMCSLCLVLYILVYARILVIVREKRKAFITPAVSSSPPEQSIRNYKGYLRDVKLVSTYILVFLFCAICYWPYMLAYQFKYIESKPCRESTASTNNFSFRILTGTLCAINSTFNCLIFFWRNKTLRNESKKVLKCSRVQTIARQAED